MKNILWISRHFLTGEQLEGLQKICCGTISVHQIQESITDIQALIPFIHEADVIACVLPVHLLAQLVALAEGKPVLVEECVRILIPQENGEPKTEFHHGCWKMIERLDYKVADPRIQ